MSSVRIVRAGPVVALVALLAACSAIPTAGPVLKGDGQVEEPGSVVVLAEGPGQDADPAAIVNGFLLAGAAGLSGDFLRAREFLAGDAVSGWDPLGGVVIASTTSVAQTTDTEVTVDVGVEGKVDAAGRYTEAPADARESVVFQMVQDSRGQWRIADAPDGLIISAATFTNRFDAATLYFLTPDATMLVPEMRWYPTRNLATSVVKGLLTGPSTWLRDAVRTEVPDGVQLKPESVVVTDGSAEVDLEPAAAVQAADRGLLLAQINASLVGLRGITSVVVRAGAGGAQLEDPTVLPTARAATLEAIAGDALVALVDGALVPADEVGTLAGLAARSPARSSNGSVRVLLDGPNTLVSAPDAADESVPLLTGPDLAAPSVDRLGWAWTATGGKVLAVTSDVAPVQVDAEWLGDRTIDALRVSRDGARIAVASTGADGTTVDVAGVVRDGDGVPQQLSEPVRVGARVTAVDAMVWADDLTLAVLGRTDGSANLRLVSVGGPSRSLPDVADAVALAADRGVRTLVVATQDGDLLRYDGQTWVPVSGATGVRDPAFPG